MSWYLAAYLVSAELVSFCVSLGYESIIDSINLHDIFKRLMLTKQNYSVYVVLSINSMFYVIFWVHMENDEWKQTQGSFYYKHTLMQSYIIGLMLAGGT